MAPRRNVIVIGAGIVGCAVTYELARRGASVQLLDDRAPGMGATQASAGVLAPYIEARDGGPLLDLTVRSLGLFDDFVADVSSASRLPIVYRRTGTIEVALHEEALRRLHGTAAVLAGLGVPAQMLDAGAARSEEPQLAANVLGALSIPQHGYVGALDLTHALVTAARRHGAQLIERRVRRVSTRGSEVVVETTRESLTANSVVLASGSWAGHIAIDGVTPPVPVRPVRGQLVHLAWQGPPLRRVTWSDRCYLVPWENGTLLVGATVEEAGFDEQTTPAGVNGLIEAACALVPRARPAAIVAAKAGLRPGTPDDLPVIGPSRAIPHLMYATGHYRNGVLLSPLTARLVADAILMNVFDPMLNVTSPQRFGEL